MEIEKMGPILVGGVTAMIGLVMLASVTQAYTPRLDYACPICGARFATYDELYSHFTIEHPAEPITIIWD